jgi:hypothetical protein
MKSTQQLKLLSPFPSVWGARSCIVVACTCEDVPVDKSYLSCSGRVQHYKVYKPDSVIYTNSENERRPCIRVLPYGLRRVHGKSGFSPRVSHLRNGAFEFEGQQRQYCIL